MKKLFIFLICILFFSAAFAAIPKNTEGDSPLSLNFQDVRVRAVLQLIAQAAGLNLITSDSVTGSITLHLNNISWQQALDIILQSQGLGERMLGNVLLIAPINEIAAHEKQELEAKQQIQDMEPLGSQLIQVHYGKATDIAALLKGHGVNLMSARGNVSADDRTNTVWVQDTSQKITEIESLIHQLDIPVKQVLIEARIVNVDSDFEDELGVRFGVTNPSHLTGTLDGADSLAGGSAASDVPVDQRLNIDLPCAVTGAAGGAASLGLALATLGKGTLLDLELSALQSEGAGQIISSPKIITADQQTAQISAGQEVPYQQSTSSGATNIAFKNAVLSLNVTPQITPDKRIILSLKVNQDKVSAREVQGIPAIDTRQIETQVLVDNGQTIVLGGIYETDAKHQVQRLPFLGSLPIVGGLFRHNLTSNERQELLIFVTPHIIGC